MNLFVTNLVAGGNGWLISALKTAVQRKEITTLSKMYAYASLTVSNQR